MAETEKQSGASSETTTESKVGFLEAAIKATKQTERSHAEALLRTFAEQALKGTVAFDKNISKSITKAIDGIDDLVSKQLAKIMHDPGFQKLEGSWRGLHYLVMNTETGTQLKLRVLNVKKRELHKDLADAVEFDQSQLYKKIYENVLYNFLSMIGVGTYIEKKKIHDFSDREHLFMGDSNHMTVNPENCTTKICMESCESPNCRLCWKCIPEKDQWDLRLAFIEHSNIGQMKRVVPPPNVS